MLEVVTERCDAGSCDWNEQQFRAKETGTAAVWLLSANIRLSYSKDMQTRKCSDMAFEETA